MLPGPYICHGFTGICSIRYVCFGRGAAGKDLKGEETVDQSNSYLVTEDAARSLSSPAALNTLNQNIKGPKMYNRS